jgi:hypothetical protein
MRSEKAVMEEPGSRYAGAMSDATQRTETRDSALDADDCAWLEERLAEYSELLKYLHDH